jgi:hypothetical protein
MASMAIAMPPEDLKSTINGIQRCSIGIQRCIGGIRNGIGGNQNPIMVVLMGFRAASISLRKS